MSEDTSYNRQTWIVSIAILFAMWAIPFFGNEARFSKERSIVREQVSVEECKRAVALDLALTKASKIGLESGVYLWIIGVGSTYTIAHEGVGGVRVLRSLHIRRSRFGDEGSDLWDVLVIMDRRPPRNRATYDLVHDITWIDGVGQKFGAVVSRGQPSAYNIPVNLMVVPSTNLVDNTIAFLVQDQKVYRFDRR